MHYPKTIYDQTPSGADVWALAQHIVASEPGDYVHIVPDERHLHLWVQWVNFFAPQIEVLIFPSWDCLPYDRVSPRPDILSQRLITLYQLGQPRLSNHRLVVATLDACIQKLPPVDVIQNHSLRLGVGQDLKALDLPGFLTRQGYLRVDLVQEPGEFAIRGNIIDIFPATAEDPIRLDLFGTVTESIKVFDPLTQITTRQTENIELLPANEIIFNEETIRCFRSQYRGLFGVNVDKDPLYEAVSHGRMTPGLEHWLPLFYDNMVSLFDYTKDLRLISLNALWHEALQSQWEFIGDYYQQRLEQLATNKKDEIPYRPIPPEYLFYKETEWQQIIDQLPQVIFSAHDDKKHNFHFGAFSIDPFVDIRHDPQKKLFDEVVKFIQQLQKSRIHVVIAVYSKGSAERLQSILKDHGLTSMKMVSSWEEVARKNHYTACMVILELEKGFKTSRLCILTEENILGQRLARAAPKRTKSVDFFMQEMATWQEGDFVVHRQHGIGRFVGLETIVIDHIKRDFVRLHYEKGDKLFVPVENMDVLTRYGSADTLVQLDRLGSVHWQNRKAKIKQRIQEIADKLLRIAAERSIKQHEAISADPSSYEEFCARFPYAETDDQQKAIDDILEDFKSGKAMDRLVCGDVGFGKTEVALRAAYVACMGGYQVAVVVPTTLLARQHYQLFSKRFEGLPIKVAQLSRFVSSHGAKQIKEDLAAGKIDIVIATHALFSKSVHFKRLGMMIVDEEQHFGVAQKEKLKELQADIHALTLTATPIPRTLQLALTGVKDLSLITTPPIDRLAVHTFILPFDEMIIREAIRRELFRGGQVFYVCPRISDLDKLQRQLNEMVDDVRLAVVHGQLPVRVLEKTMAAFCDGQYDILLCTNIIESGLDLPNVNTIIIHRADMFGLAQLYQLRGRVGRSKRRGYAYLTTASSYKLTSDAQKRLKVMHTLDHLGAGFTLASHDMDIRGAGNLLGVEQSGHIKEVGIELYQQLLEEAVADLKAVSTKEKVATIPVHYDWNPTINLGLSVLIPDNYVSDLQSRLSLYRRIAGIREEQEIDSFAAELIDRFGPLPEEVQHLLDVVSLKLLCYKANVEKIELGPKGVVIGFYDVSKINADRIIEIVGQSKDISIMPNDRLMIKAGQPQDISVIVNEVKNFLSTV